MLPFDSNDYRRRVLAAVHARGGAEQSDPFELYDIPIDEAPRLTDAQVRERIDTVWAFWQRSRDHPRYRGVIIALLGLHAELSSALATAASRAELAGRVGQARQARDGERFAELDAAVSRLVTRFGGLPEDKLAGLRALASARGIDESAFALRIRRHRVLPVGAPERATAPTRRQVPAEVLRQLRADLDELGRIAGVAPPRSLFDLLGVAPGSSREEIRSVREAAAARNRERRPDRRRALLDDLLTAVRSLLVDGDPEGYLDALVEPVKAALRPKVATAVLIEDRLLPDAAAALVADAEAEGLDPGRARAVVADLARESGVDAPVVPSTGTRPADGGRAAAGGGGAAAGGGGGDRRTAGGTEASGWAGGAGAGTGPSPAAGSGPTPARQSGPPRAADWQAALSRARAALRGGRPIAASDEVTAARELAGETLPPIRALSDEVERAIGAAAERWREIVTELAANRQQAVARIAAELARVASDVPGPDGRELADVLAQAQARCSRADELVGRARSAVGPDRVRLLRDALDAAADHAEALALTSRSASAATSPAARDPQPSQSSRAPRAEAAPVPVGETDGATVVEPPTALSARWDGSSVVLSWRATTSPGEARYRIRRITADGSSRAVGVTSATSIEDGGAPRGGPIPGYEVIAGIGGAWSSAARWPAPEPPADEDPDVTRRVTIDPRVPPVAEPLADDAAPVLVVPLAGPPTAADDLGPVVGLRLVEGRLCWTWPAGCTEMMVTARGDAPPASSAEPGAASRKVTNMRYDLDGGFMLPAVRPLHVALFACVRVGGALVVAGTAGARCRVETSGEVTVIDRSESGPDSAAREPGDEADRVAP